MDQDNIYIENQGLPGDIRTPRDRKGKGKARELSYSPGVALGALSPLKVPASHEVEAREAYLSPPLTAIASEKLLFALEDISWVFKKGLSMDFTVDLDLESDSEEASIAGDVASPASSVNELDADNYVDVEEVGENTASEVSFWEDTSSVTSSSSTPESYSSSRKATVGNTTLQDPGSAEAVVRFPSIFTQDFEISTLASSTETGGHTPIVVQSPWLIERSPEAELDVGARPSQTRTRDDGFISQMAIDKKRQSTQPRTRSSVGVNVKRKRRILRWRRKKFQEKGLSEYTCSSAYNHY